MASATPAATPAAIPAAAAAAAATSSGATFGTASPLPSTTPPLTTATLDHQCNSRASVQGVRRTHGGLALAVNTSATTSHASAAAATPAAGPPPATPTSQRPVSSSSSSAGGGTGAVSAAASAATGSPTRDVGTPMTQAASTPAVASTSPTTVLVLGAETRHAMGVAGRSSADTTAPRMLCTKQRVDPDARHHHCSSSSSSSSFSPSSSSSSPSSKDGWDAAPLRPARGVHGAATAATAAAKRRQRRRRRAAARAADTPPDLSVPSHTTTPRTSLGGCMRAPVCDTCVHAVDKKKEMVASGKPKRQKNLKRPHYKVRIPVARELGARLDVMTDRGHRGFAHPCSRKDRCAAKELDLYLLRHDAATEYGQLLCTEFSEWRTKELGLPPLVRINLEQGQSLAHHNRYIAERDAAAAAREEAEQAPGVMQWESRADTVLDQAFFDTVEDLMDADVELQDSTTAAFERLMTANSVSPADNTSRGSHLGQHQQHAPSAPVETAYDRLLRDATLSIDDPEAIAESLQEVGPLEELDVQMFDSDTLQIALEAGSIDWISCETTGELLEAVGSYFL